jgi:hypothetical protein
VEYKPEKRATLYKKEVRRMEKKKDVMKKSPALYITMLVVWTALTVLL